MGTCARKVNQIRVFSHPIVFIVFLALFFSTGCMRAKLINGANAVQPTITTVIPRIAVIKSKTQVAVIGSGFVPGATVSIGGRDCTDVVHVADTTVLCSAQNPEVGKASAVLINPNQKVAQLDDAITFTDVVKPTSGFAINAGSGISQSANHVNHSSIGELGTPIISKSQNFRAIGGIQAITQ